MEFLERYLPALLELLGLSGMLFILIYVNYTKMILGAVLTCIGAFFPRFGQDSSKPDSGSGIIKIGSVNISIKGTLRVFVVVGGLILIIGSIADGAAGLAKSKSTVENAISNVNTTREKYKRFRQKLVLDSAKIKKEVYQKTLNEIDENMIKLDSLEGDLK